MPLYFEYQSEFPVSVETLFSWHESPGAFEALLPQDGSVRLLRKDPSLMIGSETHIEVCLGPLKKLWIARHTAYEKNHFFEDVQVEGPFKSWVHRHCFFPKGKQRSLLRDEIHFELPFSPLSHVFARFLVFKKLKKTFSERHQATLKAITQSVA